MKATVKKWGNSAAVRIPASIMESTQLRLDEDVEIRELKGCIVIAPVRQKAYQLEDLVNGINANNLPVLIDFGPPAGGEVW